ncbi:MAG: DUF4190 domain-containing protein [Phycisphaerales bacterium]|nr:MAG: DUF4190 domain-containing protein [Phycisphaerales bacterium]
MSQFPPRPLGDQTAGGVPGFAAFDHRPAPYSAAAIAGFVFSLLICIPVLGGILGLVFGLVGLGSTAGGRRRGRGLAIAAIPLSLLTGFASGLFVYASLSAMRNLITISSRIEPIFQANDAALDDALKAVLAMTTPEFQQEASPEDFRQWLEDVEAEHGKLVELTLDPNMPAETTGDKVVLVLPAKFVQGPATIRVTLKGTGPLNTRLLIDDLSVGDSSPRKQ